MTDEQNSGTPPPDNLEDVLAMLDGARNRVDSAADMVFRIQCQQHRMTDTFEEYATHPGNIAPMWCVLIFLAGLVVGFLGWFLTSVF